MVRHISTFHLTTADLACFTTVGKQKAVGLQDTVFLKVLVLSFSRGDRFDPQECGIGLVW